MSDHQRPAHMHSRREIGRGTCLITFHADDDEALDYQPGHVIALDCVTANGKTLHHPYTIIENDPAERLFSFVFRHIPDGAMTTHLIQMHKGDQAHFSGKYHQPIIDEIADDVDGFVGIATGSGVGPLYGFIKTSAEHFNKRIELYVGYREVSDICLTDELDALAEQYPYFSWQVSISDDSASWNGLTGHITNAIADTLQDIKRKHFHLVGNGAMINEMRAALYAAGVPKEQVSKESFFNHGVQADEARVAELRAALTS